MAASLIYTTEGEGQSDASPFPSRQGFKDLDRKDLSRGGDGMSDNRTYALVRDGTVISDEKGQVLDLLHFSKVHVHVRVKVPANASQTLQMQHSAVDEDGAFEDLGPTYDISAAGNQIQHYSGFLRYVRFEASGSISTQPTLSVVVVAKEY